MVNINWRISVKTGLGRNTRPYLRKIATSKKGWRSDSSYKALASARP
jgi:hypothetical protein